MWRELFSNRIIWVTFYSWLIAQAIKICLNVMREKRFNFSWLITTGGMPSAHSAGVSGLATYIGLKQGFSSEIFAVSVVIALIAMFDAQTWRRSIGAQAKILNTIMEDVYQGRKPEQSRLKELIGHTPVEVFVGAILGILVAFIFYK
ncbi:MAG: divergent PAP2 family protein [Candidatus Omnitrophica bacterium]|nr:divergent PAP2 family protein [Candidatus Omnitrophota bacterium]